MPACFNLKGSCPIPFHIEKVLTKDKVYERIMSSLLEGLRHCTSRAICSNCNRQPPGTFARKEILTVIHVSKCYVCLYERQWKFVFISSVLFTEEGDIEQNKETK